MQVKRQKAHLGEDLGPDGLNAFHVGGGDQSVELLGLREILLVTCAGRGEARRATEEKTHGDLDAIVGEDEGSVAAGKLGVGHGCSGIAWA